MCKEINSEKLKEMIELDGNLQLIDVREPYEFENNHIEETRLIPLGQLQTRISEINKDKPVVFICRSGARSRMACQFTIANGYDSYNLNGGMIDWN